MLISWLFYPYFVLLKFPQIDIATRRNTGYVYKIVHRCTYSLKFYGRFFEHIENVRTVIQIFIVD